MKNWIKRMFGFSPPVVQEEPKSPPTESEWLATYVVLGEQIAECADGDDLWLLARAICEDAHASVGAELDVGVVFRLLQEWRAAKQDGGADAKTLEEEPAVDDADGIPVLPVDWDLDGIEDMLSFDQDTTQALSGQALEIALSECVDELLRQN